MRIISWNTNGLRATVKGGYFDPIFQKEKPNILCLQETKADIEQLGDEIRNYKDYFSYFASSKNKKGYSGVGVYTKEEPEKVEYGLGIKKFDDEGRTLVLYFKKFVLLNCYFPNGGGGQNRLDYKMEFYDEFLKFIERLNKKGHRIIFCGDVNTAHEEIDLARPKENIDNTGFLPEERAWIDEVTNNGYVDVFRYFYPNKKDSYTYWDQKTKARDRNVGWRIDYFFVSGDFIKDIKRTEILDLYYGSDHCPISIDIDIEI
ncbi:MAG: exodeoxyribonuclease III [Candidatus Paceibacterota bacterium]|jgi:exodeoxyribonuclease-3